MSFNGFPKKSITFLKKLENNNNLVWFEEHKVEYEKYIRDVSRDFVVEMGEHLQVLVPSINAIPKVNGSLFRIYRDLRFSKDKTPMKKRVGIIFTQGQGKRTQLSAFYLHFSAHEVFHAVGIRAFTDVSRAAYREFIKNDKNREVLHEIFEVLKREGFETSPAHYKRIPKGFENLSHNYLALNSSVFAFTQTQNISILYSSDIIDYSFKVYESMYELQKWVYEMTLTYEAFKK